MKEGGATDKGLGSKVLRAEDLRKYYGSRRALSGLSFSLGVGRVLGFLGPNGAGKTTAIRILTTILKPSSGRFTVDGISSEYPERIRRRIGVLPENLGLPKQITALEYLNFYGELYGRSARDATSQAWALLEQVGLEQRARSLIGTFSHGMRQRLGIARALVNDPVVVFLDEPTLGLDPRGQQQLLSLTRRIAVERNASVVLSSHVLPEIESVCDDIIILSSGSVVTSGSLDEVITRARLDLDERRILRVRVPSTSVSQAKVVLESTKNVIAATPLTETPGWLRIEHETSIGETSSSNGWDANSVIDALIHASIPVLNVESQGGLLDAFLQLTGRADE
jgi:ABC-2 type transport system ATP-binding protein